MRTFKHESRTGQFVRIDLRKQLKLQGFGPFRPAGAANLDRQRVDLAGLQNLIVLDERVIVEAEEADGDWVGAAGAGCSSAVAFDAGFRVLRRLLRHDNSITRIGKPMTSRSRDTRRISATAASRARAAKAISSVVSGSAGSVTP